MKKENDQLSGRRDFLKLAGIGAAALGFHQAGCSVTRSTKEVIQGFETEPVKQDLSEGWIPVSDRRIRVGIVGYGVSRWGAVFSFQDHPNVEVAAVSDLFPDRCAELAKATRCNKTYPSLSELLKDDSIEAVFLATDAPGHAQHSIDTLKHGKHVAVAVPAVFGSLEDADRLLEEVKRSGMKYMMMETSCFRENLYAMRQIYKAGGFGKLIYTEGEYYHARYLDGRSIGSYNNWRAGLPPMWYPTHNDAYYVGVTDKTFTEVSCLGMPSLLEANQPGKNIYNNPFATEIALYRTSEGGMARMARSRDTYGFGAETGRCRGQRGSYYERYVGLEENLPDLKRPPLPPGVQPGGHGGSHGYLMNEFVLSILENRKPLVDIISSLNMNVGGIVAHESAMKGGQWMKIPQYGI